MLLYVAVYLVVVVLGVTFVVSCCCEFAHGFTALVAIALWIGQTTGAPPGGKAINLLLHQKTNTHTPSHDFTSPFVVHIVG